MVLTLLTWLTFCTLCNCQIWSFFRRDYYLNDTIYPEGLSDPYYGGRWSMIFTANKHLNVFPDYQKPFTLEFADKLSIILTPTTILPDTLDWIYCDYQQSTGQVFVSLHHPTDDFFDNMASLRIKDANGLSIGSFTNINAPHCGLQLLYVTVDGDTPSNQRVIMHWYDYYPDVAYDIKQLYFNGQLLDTAVPVGPLQHTIRAYNNTQTGLEEIKPGDIWTINVILYDGLTFGFGGRFKNSKQKFNVISIPNNNQCPYPDTNKQNYDTLYTNLDITSTYLSINSSCNSSPTDIIKYYNDNWQQINNNDLTLNQELSETNTSLTEYENIADVISSLTVFEGLKPVDINATNINTTITTHNIWQEAIKRRIWYPELMTIVNTGTNHESGRYSGITDYTAVQLLFAGCAKVPFKATTTTFPVTAPYDYYENLRLNNMPYSTFGVIQAFDGNIYLNKAEITLAIGQGLAAGLQGFILKTDLSQLTNNKDTWNVAESLMNNIKYLDKMGMLNIIAPHGAPIMATSVNNESLWSALRAMDTLIIVGINTNCDGYDLSKCVNDNIPHWICKELIVNMVNIRVPPDWQQDKNLKLSVMELVNGTQVKPTFDTSLINNNTNLVFNNVDLDSDETVRIFVVSYLSN